MEAGLRQNNIVGLNATSESFKIIAESLWTNNIKNDKQINKSK